MAVHHQLNTNVSKYIIKQGVGGSGFGLDIGVVSRPLSGWKFGLSIINLLGSISWEQGGDESTSSLNPLTNSFYPFRWGDDELSSDEYIEYTFTIDTIRVDKMSNDSLFKNETRFLKIPSNAKDFITRIPATFRAGLSKQFDNFFLKITNKDHNLLKEFHYYFLYDTL